jgi:hypothetical protein
MVSWSRISLAGSWLGVAALSAAFGVGVAVNRQVTFVALVALLGVAAAAAPASAWVCAALVAALTFKGLVSIGVLPSVATFIDLPLAWGALFVGLLKKRERSPFLTRHLRWLAALAVATWLAWAFNPSEVLRPVLYLMLLGEPFAIVAALLSDPPSPRMRRALELTLLGLVLIQIPFAAIELLKLGPTDHVQGTLYLAGAGAHVISAVCIVGAIWILAGGIGRRVLGVWRLPVVGALFAIPFIADAKQVIFALPAIVLASSWSVNRPQVLMRVALVVGSLVALLTLAPAGAPGFIEQAEHGHGGKQAAATFVWHKFAGDPASMTFGKGPAETVSRAAFMTTDLFQRAGTPLAVLGLKPAETAMQAEDVALVVSQGGGTSFNSGTSSAIGVLGDLGIFGLVVYSGLFLSLFLKLRTITSPEGVAAAAGFALFLVLGLVFDWWEQPPLGVLIGVLAGLALTGRSAQYRRSVPRLAASAHPAKPDEVVSRTMGWLR